MAGYNLGTASGRIEIDGSGAAKGFQAAQQAGQAFFDVISEKVNQVDQIGTKLTAIGTTAAVGFGLAINTAAGFEAQLSGIQAVSGATEEQMSAVSDAALRIGKDSVYSASEAASAIEEILKAGVSLEDVLGGAADATVNLAAAGGISLPEAATIASNALNNFGLAGQDMVHVADLISGAANASAIDVSEFGMSLSQSGAVANLAGLKFDDLAVAIAEMGQAGIKGSDAGTSIKTFLQNLIPTTTEQINLFEKMGLVAVRSGEGMAKLAKMGIKPVSQSYDDVTAALSKYVEESGGAKVGTAANVKATQKLGTSLGVLSNEFFDAQGNVKSMADIQGVLAEATKGMTREQKLANLEVLFGSDAIRAAAVFADQGADGYNKMAGAMSKVSAADVAATRLDNFRGALEQLKGSLETARIIVGTYFLPALTAIVKALGVVVDVFNNAPSSVQGFIAVVLGLGGALSLLAGVAIKLAFVLVPLLAKFLGLSALKSVFSILTTGFAALRGGGGILAAVAASVGRAGAVFGRFAAIGRVLFGVLTSLPGIMRVIGAVAGVAFGPIGIAIGLVVTALILLYKHFAPFRDFVNSIGRTIQAGFVRGLQLARQALDDVVAGFNGVSGGSGVTGFFQQIGAAARVVWTALQQVASVFRSQLLPALQGAGAQIWAALQAAFAQVAAVVRGQLIPAFQQVGAAIAPLMPYLKQAAAAVGLFLAKLAGGAILGSIQQFALFLVVVAKIASVIVGTVLPAVVSFSAALISGIVNVLGVVISAITGFISSIASFVSGIIGFFTGAGAAAQSGGATIGSVLSSIGSFFTTAFQGILTFVTGVFNAVWSFITSVLTAISTTISTILAFIGGVWNAFWSTQIGQTVLNALGLVNDLITLVLTAIVVGFQLFAQAVASVWTAVWTGLTRIVSSVWGTIRSVVSSALAAITAVVSAGMNAVRAVFSAVWSALVAIVAPRIAAIRAAVSAGFNAIRAVTSSVWNSIRAVISAVVSAIASAVSSRVAAIRSAVSSAWSAVRSLTTSAWNAFQNTIRSKVDAAMAVVRAIRGKVIGALSGAGSWLVSAGRAIIQGLLNGINSMIGAVRGKLQSLTNLIKESKGPPKVDRVLLTPAGEQIIRSLMVGFDNQVPDMLRQLRAVTRDIPAAATTSIGSAGSSPRLTIPPAALQQLAAGVHQEVTIINPTVRPAALDVNDSLQLAGVL